MDFALPSLKIDIEADGELHMIAGHPERDKERDYLLAQRGWTVLRFDDKVIEEAPHQVKATINSYITKAMESTPKTASGNGAQLPQMANYFTYEDGGLKDLQGNAVKYYKTISNDLRVEVEVNEGFGKRSSEEYFAATRKV